MDVHRISLGLAVVEGDRPARGILGDLLEEQGERGLAQWARRCGAKKKARLEFGIMLLPCEPALDLGRQFVVWNSEIAAPWLQLNEFFAVHHQWQAERSSHRSFHDTRAALNEAILRLHTQGDARSYRRGAPREVQRGLECFREAMQCVHNFRQSQHDDGDGKSYHWQLAANQHVREVSECLHRIPTIDPIAWQFEVVVETYRKLLSP